MCAFITVLNRFNRLCQKPIVKLEAEGRNPGSAYGINRYEEFALELRDIVSSIRRRWISALVILVLFVLAAIGLTIISPKIYTAHSQSFVALTGTGDSIDPLTGAQFAAARVKSYPEIVSSPEVLQPVIDQLHLSYSVADLSRMVSVTNPPATVLLDTQATSQSPVEAAAIADAVARQLALVIEKLETPAGATQPPLKVTLTNPAIPPTSASAPRPIVNVVLGLILGIAVALVWIFVRNALDNTIKSSEEIRDIAGAPNLGAVLFDKQAKTHGLAALDTVGLRSEGYRTIRANMQFVNVDKPPRSVVVTSAAPGDGKTTTACNLAVTIALQGKSVCLVEADLRRPRMNRYLDLADPAGLTEVLSGQRELSNVTQSWNRGLISVIASGSIPPNPSELLASAQMRKVLQELTTKYDIVLLDASPLLAVADAATVAAITDGAILVTRFGKSTRDQIRHAMRALAQSNATVLGTVLNAVPVKGGTYGYGYSYDYSSKGKGQSSPPGIIADNYVRPESPAAAESTAPEQTGQLR